MSNKTVIELGSKVLTFDFGEFTLDYRATDKKDGELQAKSRELVDKSNAFKDKEAEMNDQENRQAIKPLLDEFFSTMFDSDATKKIYGVVGENTWNYLNVFLQISNNLEKEWNKKLNDENFKKYLAE
ncbi:hypothetical protein [Streptococcus dysgalactiae]|uniref:Uncharacterized protein n=1 Tax=Streptococcus dysgalactiae subsp. equisimilis TaxID=119602 RepID=A0AAE9U2J7_STREQ|nr:hypothetical protein [Streptococcus dysgalactiae]VTT17752.1 Uncharacterised protein [Streptococcus dysgalactiae]VTT27441.1 Uncharacterised protein [Streptococcus dysgalactiae subsp. equisimilis]